jgi:multiple antibiotic resistance protein
MHDAIKAFFLAVSALLPIVDPLSNSPIFLALTQNVPPKARRELSWRVTVNSFLLMVGSYLVGSHVLHFFGVSLASVQIGGGAVVFSLGWTLLMNKGDDRNAVPEAAQSQNILNQAFYPLTLPLTVGPGSISVAITIGANSTHKYGVRPSIIGAGLIAIAVVAATIYVCYRFADWLGQKLGETGTAVVIRLSAFLLVCLGVQIVCNGIEAFLGSVRFQAK